ncbi:MAG: DUF5711 family protein [Eubacteriales bacterium]|nr:DUF5711 family protein [Eubacteriales bacterium]
MKKAQQRIIDLAYLKESREANKQRLRENVISNTDSGKDDFRLSPIVFIIVVLFCIAGIAFGIYWVTNRRLSTEYSVQWERNSDDGTQTVETFKGYKAFAGGIIKYTKDGAEYIDKKGNVVWERSYQLNSPIIEVSSKYAVIGDQGGTDLFIFDSTSMTGSSETIFPISILKISDNGVVYGVLNDSAAEYIAAFKSDGTAIDLSVKSVVIGDGYPFDIAVSPDGTELLTSYVSIENGQINNNIVFRNFGAIGQNEDARRIVGGFKDEFAGFLAGRVNFSTNEYSQAFYDGGVAFFSTEVLNSPELIANERFDEKIETIGYSEEMVAVALSAESSEASPKLLIYNCKGELKASIDIDYKYSEMCVTGNSVVLRSGNEIHVYGKNGVLRANFEFTEGEITKIVGGGSDNELFALTGNLLYRIRY